MINLKNKSKWVALILLFCGNSNCMQGAEDIERKFFDTLQTEDEAVTLSNFFENSRYRAKYGFRESQLWRILFKKRPDLKESFGKFKTLKEQIDGNMSEILNKFEEIYGGSMRCDGFDLNDSETFNSFKAKIETFFESKIRGLPNFEKLMNIIKEVLEKSSEAGNFKKDEEGKCILSSHTLGHQSHIHIYYTNETNCFIITAHELGHIISYHTKLWRKSRNPKVQKHEKEGKEVASIYFENEAIKHLKVTSGIVLFRFLNLMKFLNKVCQDYDILVNDGCARTFHVPHQFYEDFSRQEGNTSEDDFIPEEDIQDMIEGWKDCIPEYRNPDNSEKWSSLRTVIEGLKKLSDKTLERKTSKAERQGVLCVPDTRNNEYSLVDYLYHNTKFKDVQDIINFFNDSENKIKLTQNQGEKDTYHYNVMIFQDAFFTRLLSENLDDMGTEKEILQSYMREKSLCMQLDKHKGTKFVVVTPGSIPFDDMDFEDDETTKYVKGMLISDLLRERKIAICDFLGCFEDGVRTALGKRYDLFDDKKNSQWEIFRTAKLKQEKDTLFNLMKQSFRSLFTRIGMTEDDIARILPNDLSEEEILPDEL